MSEASCKKTHQLISHPHLLVRVICERFLHARATFRVGLASESHWLQLVLVLTVHCGWAMMEGGEGGKLLYGAKVNFKERTQVLWLGCMSTTFVRCRDPIGVPEFSVWRQPMGELM